MKVSLITPTYNSEKVIDDMFNSLENQDYNDIEHIIIDGVSTDGTVELIRERAVLSTKILVEKDNGIYDAINKGLKLAKGDIVAILHSDDVIAYPSAISDIVNRFNTSNNLKLLYSNLSYYNHDFTKKIRVWSAGEFDQKLLKKGWMPPHPTLFMRKEVLKEIGNYDTSYRISGDYDFLIRAFMKIKKENIGYLNKTTYHMRIGGVSNANITTILTKMIEDLRAIKSNNIGGLKVLFLKNIRKMPQFFKKSDKRLNV